MPDGPPWTHTYRPPGPVPVLDPAGQPVIGADGEPLLDVPLLPGYTLTRNPQYSGVLDYLKEQQWPSPGPCGRTTTSR